MTDLDETDLDAINRDLEVMEAAGLDPKQKTMVRAAWVTRNFVLRSALASKPIEEWTVDDVIRAVKEAG